MITSNLQIIMEIRSYLKYLCENKVDYVTKSGDFTRSKKLPFLTVCLFILNLPKRALSTELTDFFDELYPFSLPCTASALSQARYKILPCLFQSLMEKTSELFYTKQSNLVKRWKGYKLDGVDGSTLNLPDSESIHAYFEVDENIKNSVAKARIVCRYDLLNDIVKQASIGSMKTGEAKYAMAHLDNVDQDVISIYDRNFPSFEFIYEHSVRNLHFVMRCKVGFNKVVKEFVSSGKKSEIVDFYPSRVALKNLLEKGYSIDKNTILKVRLERIELVTGEVEILITSLLDTNIFTNDDLDWLYGKRWGSETNYDSLKNKLKVELFTGQKPASVLQDFYATISVYNFNALLVKECEPEVEKISETRVHNYKVNKSVSIGITKPRLVKLLFKSNEQEVEMILEYLKLNFINNIEPIRPNRSYPRIKKRTGGRNKVRPLKNYKRAI